MSSSFFYSLNIVYLVLTISFVTCQYYELEGEEFYPEGQGEAEEADTGNATQAPAQATATTVVNGSTTLSPSMQRVISQVGNVVSNVETLNITGIVDQALGIRNNTEVRKLVNMIMRAVFCNSFLAGYNNCGTRN